MSLRLELLRWVNEKCPKMKASNIESLSDGRHYLFLLKKYFPEIQVPPFRKQWSVSQKLESLGQVQQYCQKLDGQITMDLYKMANKDSGLLINLLKWLKNIYDKTPQKSTPMKEEIIQQRNDVIVEEVPLGKQFEDKRTQTEEKILSVNVIKSIFSLNLPYPFFQIELIKHLDQNDPEVKKLACHYKQSVGTLSKCADSQEETRRTEFYSIHSSQFYERPEMNLLDIEFVENTCKRSDIGDSYFQVSEEKQK